MQEREQEGATPAQEPAKSAAPVQTPPFGQGVARAPQIQVAVDSMPSAVAVLAAKPPEERIAIYLNSIRKMLIFFTVLVVIGIVAGVILAIVDIQAVHSAQTCTGFGC